MGGFAGVLYALARFYRVTVKCHAWRAARREGSPTLLGCIVASIPNTDKLLCQEEQKDE